MYKKSIFIDKIVFFHMKKYDFDLRNCVCSEVEC